MNKEFSIANGKAEYAEKYQLFDAMVDPVRGLVRGGDTHPSLLVLAGSRGTRLSISKIMSRKF